MLVNVKKRENVGQQNLGLIIATWSSKIQSNILVAMTAVTKQTQKPIRDLMVVFLGIFHMQHRRISPAAIAQPFEETRLKTY